MYVDRRGKIRDDAGLTGYQWMCMVFEFEWCEECGKGARDHEAIPFLGNWFARCKNPQES